MSLVHLDAIYTVRKENLTQFKQLTEQAMKVTREKDTRTLRYDFFFNHDESVFIGREIYEGLEGLVESIQNLGDLLPQVMALSEFKIILYGDMTDELRAFAKENNFELYARHMSLDD